MRFGPVPLAEAEGAILAHSVRLPGGAFKKGRVLSADDVKALAAAGRSEVIAARLGPGDIGEDAAADTVASALMGDGLVKSAAFTGRCNLFASARGVAVVDAERINRINLVDESITVATVPPYALVEPRQMVATIKIIPFAAPAAAVEAVHAIAATGGPAIRAAALKPHRVGLIQTRLPGLKDSVVRKTEETTRARLASLGSDLVAAMVVDHEEGAVARAIAEQRDAGCDPILVLGASAIVDRRDVIPAGIERAQGQVLHFGMPVDPGNLLMLGRVANADVVGLPGCARSPKLNGMDWVLQRLLADLPVDRRDIMLMGAGGLLTEVERPLPRKDASPEPLPFPRAPRIAAVVLAAGRSTRMAPANKLLVPFGGAPMVTRAVDAALASQADPVIVVVGHDAPKVREALGARTVRVVENPDFADGLSTSVRAGLAALPSDVDGALFMLGDMPRVTAVHLDRLIAAFNPAEGRAICMPTFRAKRGNPVLWASRFFPELATLSGDAGARGLIGQHSDQLCEVEMADGGVLLDVDTPEALAETREAG
jgi:molybdenum cofactor cytidylyltransferase